MKTLHTYLVEISALIFPLHTKILLADLGVTGNLGLIQEQGQ